VALDRQNNLARAIESFRRAAELDPSRPDAPYNLGKTSWRIGDLPGAVAAYEKAIALDPGQAEAHCDLGLVLRQLGRFAPALEHLRKGHDLGSRRPGWAVPSAGWVIQARRLAALEAGLPAFLRGDARPAGADEAMALAEVCRAKRRHASAFRFCEAAFAAEPARADGLRTWARFVFATSAVLAGAGEGEDAAELTDADRDRLRRRALDWLRADLTAWSKQAERPEGRPEARQALRHWKTDPSLSSVREPRALAKLSEADGQAWRQLWADVDASLEKAGR
jgi:tetratricopeptide (TPR) repeat protein